MSDNTLNQNEIDNLISSFGVATSNITQRPQKTVNYYSTSSNRESYNFLKPYLKKDLSQITIFKQDDAEYISVEDLKNCFVKLKDLRMRIK